jgi:hypothetical protein
MGKRLAMCIVILLVALLTGACQWCLNGVRADGTCASVSGGPAPTATPAPTPTP